MGKEFRDKFNVDNEPTTTPEMRELCQRPGRHDEHGNIIYFTEQAHKDACDVNKIIRKYDKTGLISHISKIEGQFGDVSGEDFKSMQDTIVRAQQMFDQLPSEIRVKFQNSPQTLLAFMDDPNNRQEAIDLGLIRADWTEATDGLGEHVKEGENITKEQQAAIDKKAAEDAAAKAAAAVNN